MEDVTLRSGRRSAVTFALYAACLAVVGLVAVFAASSLSGAVPGVVLLVVSAYAFLSAWRAWRRTVHLTAQGIALVNRSGQVVPWQRISGVEQTFVWRRLPGFLSRDAEIHFLRLELVDGSTLNLPAPIMIAGRRPSNPGFEAQARLVKERWQHYAEQTGPLKNV